MINKKRLEMDLQKIPPHPNPKVEYEQYSTPATLASDLLWNAYTFGDIENKNILDLGCGTGIFVIGSLKLGATSAIGIDIDAESIKVANDYCNDLNIKKFNFITSDIEDITPNFEINTIFQNPPFGSQKKAKKGADLKFINKACEFNPEVIYSFHMASTQEFLIDYFNQKGFEVTHILHYEFKIPKLYDFHNKESKKVKVMVVRAKNNKI